MTTQEQAAPLLNGAQTVRSIRDTGYKSTDYAIAELIDNAAQAGADNVTVVAVEKPQEGRVRTTTQIFEIWVLDDGSGMDDWLANTALSFGGSDRYDDRSGIGRFGMGLPQASVSQCKRTDLWTWQDSGVDNASHTYLDLDQIEESNNGDLRVPWPSGPGDDAYVQLPEWVRRTAEQELAHKLVGGQQAIPSGTIIRWSNLDKVRWARSSTIRQHTEYLLGRVYRRFIEGTTASGRQINLKFAIISESDGAEGKTPRDLNGEGDDTAAIGSIKPNDPMYLARPDTQHLGYWEKDNPDWDGQSEDRLKPVTDTPPFKLYEQERTFELEGPPGSDGSRAKGTVTLKCAMAREGVRPSNIGNPGRNTHQGRHFYRNRGISVMRADREILLEESYVYEATDRWWRVELSFEPVLDEVFGVTNNKQDVPHFTTALRHALNDDDPAEQPAVRDAISEGEWTEDHSLAQLYDVAAKCVALIRKMRTDQKEEHTRFRRNAKKGSGQGKKPPMPSVSVGVKKEREESTPTKGEQEWKDEVAAKGEEAARETNAERIRNHLVKDLDLSEEEADAVVDQYKHGLTLQVIDHTQPQAPAFFWPEEYGEFQSLNINISHPASGFLLDSLRLSDEKINALSEEEAKQLLGAATDSLGWLLLSWSRMELEHSQAPDGQAMARFREQWGRMLSEIITSRVVTAAREHTADLEALLGDEEDDE